jgi:hypothetical protein
VPRAVMRPVVVRRLLAVGEAGGVSRVHVRIAAEAVGVSERTVWRWLALGRGGQIEAVVRRGGFGLDDVLWKRLGDLGGNVSELYRQLTDGCDDPAGLGLVAVPSLSTVMRAVRRDLRDGRVLEIARAARERVDPGRYDRALAELALPGVVETEPDTDPAGPPVMPAGGGVRLYAPGAALVSTAQLSGVVEAVGHTVAARGLLCVYGDAGYGKTVAVHRALRLLPRRTPVWSATVAVKPALPQLRAMLLAALGLPAGPLSHRADATDRALMTALQQPGVLFLDDAQRLAPPELDYLRLLMDASTTQAALVVCGAGAERVVQRAPALASRILTWAALGLQPPGHQLTDSPQNRDIPGVSCTYAVSRGSSRSRAACRPWPAHPPSAFQSRARGPEAAVRMAKVRTWSGPSGEWNAYRHHPYAHRIPMADSCSTRSGVSVAARERWLLIHAPSLMSRCPWSSPLPSSPSPPMTVVSTCLRGTRRCPSRS